MRLRPGSAAVLVALFVVSGVSLPLARPATAYEVAERGFAFVDSEAGDEGGRQQQRIFTHEDAEFQAWAMSSSDPGTVARIDVVDNPEVPYGLSVQLQSANGSTLGVGHYDVTGAYSGPHMWIHTLGGYCPDQRGSFDIQDIGFSGTQVTRLAASWEIFCRGVVGSPAFRGQLRFNSDVPAIGRAVSALPVEFGPTVVGTSASRELTITNPMPNALTGVSLSFTGPDAAEFSVASPTCPPSIPAGGSCTATLTFTPQSRHFPAADLMLFDSVTPSGRKLAMVAQGVAPVLSASSSLHLPSVRLDDASWSSFAITNSGDAPLTVTDASITGPHAEEFEVVNDTCQQPGPLAVIPSNAQCFLRVWLAPVATGPREATLTLSSDGGVLDVALRGTGIWGSLSAPAEVRLPAAAVGRSSTAPLTLSNPGSASVTILDIFSVGGDDDAFSITGGSCFNWYGDLNPIWPGTSCTLDVEFAPTRIGQHVLSLVIAADVGDVAVTLLADGTPQPNIPPPSPAPATSASSGYWMVGAGGDVFAFGDAPHLGNVQLPAGTEAVDLEPTPSGRGYWVVTASGSVYALGDARWHGGSPALRPGERVTSLSGNRDGSGYWQFTSTGRVLGYGAVEHFGDMSGVPLNAPVLDSIPTPTARGYYMVAADGGIFTFGDAEFHGSMGDVRLNQPVQSLVPDPDGRGYWLVAADGGIFAFEAEFYGSMGGTRLNRPITGMIGYGNGYLMVAEDGGIFSFGEAPFHGSLGSNPPRRPITAVARR